MTATAQPLRGDDPRWQVAPLHPATDAVNAPVIARFHWYWSLSPEQRARVDAGLDPTPAPKPRRKGAP